MDPLFQGSPEAGDWVMLTFNPDCFSNSNAIMQKQMDLISESSVTDTSEWSAGDTLTLIAGEKAGIFKVGR